METIRSVAATWFKPLLGIYLIVIGANALFGLGISGQALAIFAIVVGVFALLSS